MSSKPPAQAQPLVGLSTGDTLRSMHLSTPLAACAVLLVVGGFDGRLYGFLAHVVAAMGCFMLLAVVSSRYVSRNAGYLRYLGFTLPWVALFELAIAFGAAHGGAARAYAPELHAAAFFATAGALAVAPLWIGRRVRVWHAVLPWAVVSALLFAAILRSSPAAGTGAYAVQLGDVGTAILFVFGIGGLVRRRAAFEAVVFGLLLAGAVLAFVAFAVHAIDLHERAEPLIDMARVLGLWLFYVAAVRSLVAAPPDVAVDYHGLFESAVVGVALTRADATYMTVNPAYAKLFGYASPRDMMEALPDAWALFADPEGRAHLVEELSQGRAVHGAELCMRRRDGSLVWVSCSIAAVRSQAGSVVGFQSVVLDITQARAAREEARHSNERFEIVARATNDAVWDWDLQADTVWWNESYQALFGYTNRAGKPSAESWSDHIHPEDRATVIDGIQAALAGPGASWSAEYRFLRRDGTYADVHDRGYIVRGADGRPARMIGAMQDITQRKSMEGALRQSEQRLRDLVEISSDWYWEQDAELRFTMIEGPDALIASGGRAPASVIGKRRWELPFNEPVSGDWAAHRATLERREPFRNFLIRRPDPDGCMRYLSISGEPLFDAGGEFRGYRGTGSDVTARERAEQERSKTARLYASLSSLNELVARATTEAELLQGACEIAVASGDFQFAAVRRVEGERALLVAVAGTGMAPVMNRPLDFSPGSPDADSLAATAYRSGRPAVATGAAFAGNPFLERVARETGARAVAAYPLFRGGACAGVLFLNSREASAFEGQTGELLARMAGSVSIGLDALAANDALRRFRLALDQSGELIAIVDLETMRYVDVNDPLCAALGYTREELLGMHPDELIPYDRETLRATYRRLTEGEEVPAIRSHYKCKDGSLFPYESRRHAVLSEGRWLIVSIARDIRAELQAEEALRRTDAYFRSLIENASDAVAAADMDWRYLYVSPAIATLTGYPLEEVRGKRFGDTSVRNAPEVRARLERALASGAGPQSVHFDCVRRDGVLRRHESVVSKGVGPDGSPIYVIVSRDITDRIAAEEQLRRREQELRELVRNSPDIISRWSPDLRCLFVNDALRKASGKAPEEVIGQRLGEMGEADEFVRLVSQSCAEVIATGEPRSAEFTYPAPGGTLQHYEMRMLPERGADGRVASVLMINRDMTSRVRAEAEARRRDEEFRAVAENAPDGIMRFDPELRCLYANAALVKTAGRPREAMLGVRLPDFKLPAALKDAIGSAVLRALETGDTQTIEFRFAGPRGERHYQARLAPERSADGRVTSVLGISRDITDRKNMERAMEQSEARLRSIVFASAEPLLLVDAEGRTLFANPAAGELFGRPEAAMEGTPLGLPLTDGRPAEVDIVLPGGGTRPAEMQSAPAEIDGREVLVVSLHDLSERKRFEEHIQHLATHDRLTGLPNRALLNDRVEQAILQARRTEGSLALLFVDLDQFKLVNDSFGHAAGDALLMEAAGRLKETVRDGDTVARLGGDEFVILLTNLSRPGDSALVARKIAEALDRPVAVGGREMRVTASIGISLFPDDGENLDALLQSADAAMYRAKDAGRNAFHYYSAEMGEQARARVETEAGLRRAIERDEFRLHYQPQIDLATGRVAGLEALLRWEHPQRGMVAPMSFIPVAEECGLIVPIGQWALREACREAAGWRAAGLGDVKVAVNLSARQFWRGSVTEAVRAALGESGLPASQLELEITETVVARDLQQVTLALEQLRRMGVTLAIDDFGTGYSSLAYLRSLPIQKVKIDKSFIKGIPADKEATALVGEIIRLAHVLSLKVVAEGVETDEQARFLRDAGCEAMQGFLFSRPVPGAEASALLRGGRRFTFGK